MNIYNFLKTQKTTMHHRPSADTVKDVQLI